LGIGFISCFVSERADGQQPIVVANAQQGGARMNRSSYGYVGGRSRLPDDTIQMLRLPQIREELGLHDDQVETIGRLSTEMQKQIRDVFRSADFTSGDVSQIMREAQSTIRIKTEEKLEEILLPQQLTRLKQIRVQILLQKHGPRALLSGMLADEVRLSDKQKDELIQVHNKNTQELEREIAKLRDEYMKKTLDTVLNDSQMDTIEKLSGKEYESKPVDYRAMYQRNASKNEEEKAKRNAAAKD
jgi:hypothetical protein